MEITIEIAGNPVPKARARVTKAGHAFTPTKTRKWEAMAAVLAQQEMRGKRPISGPVEVFVLCVFPIPASWPRWKRTKALVGGIGHTTRPDADNVAKAATDALSGIVYRDDSQITDLIVRKCYGEIPSVTIRVRETGLLPAQQKRRAP